ncbi:MAG: tetratricopeptide repeat protein [Salinivirgaceae bacterium]|nr:tetratricopeptide repeat protein [Salinivirgaceae bacterium]
MSLSSNPKRSLIIVMSTLFVIGFAVAKFYYSNENKYVDPRVIPARELYSKYNAYAEDNNFSAVFSLLDSIETIYKNIAHYKNSYEIGVLYNNRAASYLTMAIHFADSSLSLNGVTILSTDSLLSLGKINAKTSIEIYQNWLDYFSEKELDKISTQIKSEYIQGITLEKEADGLKFLEKRMEEIETAKYETPRRLSVAYTNLGIVERHAGNLEEAVKLYIKALELWERNLSAKNNINVLLGRPLEKGRVIHKFFPPDKAKK